MAKHKEYLPCEAQLAKGITDPESYKGKQFCATSCPYKDCVMAFEPETRHFHKAHTALTKVERKLTTPEERLMQVIFNKEAGTTYHPNVDGTSLHDALMGVLNSIGPRYRRVIMLRFGFESQSNTLQQIGTEFGVSRERIRQLETKALNLLRHISRKDKLRAFNKEGPNEKR